MTLDEQISISRRRLGDVGPSGTITGSTVDNYSLARNGQTNEPLSHNKPTAIDHPIYPVFIDAIEQAMFGKGERHGGATIPFLKQPWSHYADMHGRGFLTGQAAKKLEEAASIKSGDEFVNEVRGAMVYLAMAILKEENG